VGGPLLKPNLDKCRRKKKPSSKKRYLNVEKVHSRWGSCEEALGLSHASFFFVLCIDFI
jgi:hypothetical protein